MIRPLPEGAVVFGKLIIGIDGRLVSRGSAAAEVPWPRLGPELLIKHLPSRDLNPSTPSAMSGLSNTLNTANGRESDRKDRTTSGSDDGHANVVDHHAPHGESRSFQERGEECPPRSRFLIHVFV